MRHLILFCSLLSSMAWAQGPLDRGNYETWLSAKIIGNGQDLIFIPGYGCRGEVWEETAQALAGQYRCHLLTLHQFEGELGPDTALLEGTLNALWDYCQQEAATPILVGHSIGGFLSLAVAARYPEGFEALVSVDALPYLAAAWSPNPQQMDPAQAAGQYQAMDSATFANTAFQAARTMVSNEDDAHWVANWAQEADRQAYGYLFAEFYNTDLRDSLNHVACPTLSMVARGMGEASTMAIWKGQYAQLPQVTFAYHPEALHFIMLDDPDWFLSHLQTFLKSHAPTN